MAEAPGGRLRARWGSSLVVGGAFLLLVLVTVLFTPRETDARGALSSYSAAPGGARGLYEALDRLGWQVARRERPFTEGMLDSSAVYAVLDPALPVTPSEVHRLLETVRAGAGLLLVVRPDDLLADSLGLARSEGGAPVDLAPDTFCPDSLNRTGLLVWPGGRMTSWWLTQVPRGATTFTTVRRDTAGPRLGQPPASAATVASPAMVGFALGRGRVVAAADPDLLRNDVLRVCRWNAGVTAVRAMEWLAAAGRDARVAVFDEFHHGFGTHADPLGAAQDALVGTGPGRMVLQLAAAALLLLAAVGIRAIPPRQRHVVERRSPLEHVGALARAYEQVGATRLAARRLVRGLRRRHAAGVRAGASDATFLESVATRRRGVADDAELLERALVDPVPASELTTVGAAAARVDEALRAGP